ncbi:MAG: DNA topoisomerase I, partial [Cyanobacteriota bacterium]
APSGHYEKPGTGNAPLPEGPTADTLPHAQAQELRAATAATAKGKGRTAAKKATTGTRKAAATKPAASAARKPPATTTTGRLRASAVRVIKAADS